MNVAFCAYDKPGYLAGGPNAWLLRLLPELARSGMAVTALIIGHGPAQECPFVKALHEHNIPVRFLENSARNQFVERRIEWILQQVAELQPDVFIPNLMVSAFYAAKWLKQKGIPSIGVVHSNDSFYDRFVETFVCGEEQWRIDCVVAVSRFLESKIAARRRGNVRLERIPYGVPMPLNLKRTPSKKLRVAYVGRFDQKQKRILDVTTAFCEASKAVPGAEFTLIGDGGEVDKMREIIAASGGGNRVHIAGPIHSSKIQDFMTGQDVFVLLSDYEGLSIAQQEAMATGMVPVCLMEESGTAELIQHRQNGLIVQDRGSDFIAAIRELDGDRELLRKMGLCARQTIERGYASPIQHEKWRQLLRSVGTGRKKGRVRVPLSMTLPESHPDFNAEDIHAPKLAARMKNGFSEWVYHTRLAIRPRTRLRQLRNGPGKPGK
jgi:colanic acid/amylovoran biosynthesis glycosyltransferase